MKAIPEQKEEFDRKLDNFDLAEHQDSEDFKEFQRIPISPIEVKETMLPAYYQTRFARTDERK